MSFGMHRPTVGVNNTRG